jgi:hypothetical protein
VYGSVDTQRRPKEAKKGLAFDTLLPTRRQMTTAPIMLPTSLPSRVSGVATEQDPSETPYTTDGDRYAILFLYSEPDPAK